MTKCKYFTAKNLDDLKQEYRKLVFVHHPDRGGSTETMQEVNAEYDYLNEALAKEEYFGDEEKYKTAVNVGAEMAKVIQAIVAIPDIEIEVCGVWLWVTGKTSPPISRHSKKRGSCGQKTNRHGIGDCQRTAQGGTRWHKGNCTLEEIRAKYGSQPIVKKELERIG